MMFLSVIIPTRNRAKYLTNTLASLTKQIYSADCYELLVIDNGSTDNTRDVCATFRDKIPQLRYFYEEKPGLHVGRHLGMKMAKAELLVFADDDIEAFPTWLEAIAESFQDPEVVLVGGKNLPRFEAAPPDWIHEMWERDTQGNRVLGYLSILDLGNDNKDISPYHVFGCNFSIRKSILLKARGFHPDSVPEELIRYRGDGETHVSKFIKANSMRTFYHPGASVYHAVPKERMTLQYFRKRAYNEGISRSFTEFRHKIIIDTDCPPQPVPAGFIKKTHAFFGGTKIGKVLNMIMRRLKMSLSGDAALAEKYWQFNLAMLQGWTFHRKAMENTPELRSYVLKDHYMD